jgi:ADP-ribose pyrophosphatase YjhB (NUDIX family)
MYCSSCGHRLPAPPPATCGHCGASHWRNAKPCAGALVLGERGLLLVRRANDPWRGCWDIPGGFCEPDEHPIVAAAREVAEETGHAVRIVGFLGIWLDEYGEPPPGMAPETTMNVYYHAVSLGPPEAESSSAEVAEVEWFAPDELPAEIAFPGHAGGVLAAWRAALDAGRLATPLPDRP